MIEIDDINDRHSLKQWLTEWPEENGLDEEAARAVAVCIAHRAAMRVLPVWWVWTLGEIAHKLDLTALPILRCGLVSGVAVYSGSLAVNEIAVAAAGVARTLINQHEWMTDDANFLAAFSSIEMAGRGLKSDVTGVLGDAAKAYSVAAEMSRYGLNYGRDNGGFGGKEKFWKTVQWDCKTISEGGDALAAPLWADHNNPLEEIWLDIKTGRIIPRWSFWIKWYDDALAGNPPNWDMLEQIVLIEPDVWEDGKKAVAEEIAKIVEKFDLLDEVRSLKKARPSLLQSTASSEQRSHNQPPELIDVSAEIAGGVTFVWDNLDHAEKELEKSDPEMGRLEVIARAILQGITNVAKYCAKVGDTSIMAGAKVVGAGGGALLLDYFFNSGRVLEFANRLLQYATGG